MSKKLLIRTGIDQKALNENNLPEHAGKLGGPGWISDHVYSRLQRQKYRVALR
jgi:hypothetical protein